MKTFDQLAKEYLTPPEYERFKINIGEKINQAPHNDASFIDKAFIWRTKSEGEHYWNGINERCYRRITGKTGYWSY